MGLAEVFAMTAARREPGDELRALIREEVARVGTVRAVAKALDLTEGRLGKVLRGEFSLSVLSCLRLAKMSGKPPGQILRAAGKGEVVDLIDELYAINEDAASPSELDLLRRFRALPAQRQAMAKQLIATLAEGSSPAVREAGATSRKTRRA